MTAEKKKDRTCLLIGAAVGCGTMIILIPILAAIALPMYSTFKQKSKVGAVLQQCQSSKAAFEAWYEDQGNFDGMSVAQDGGAIMSNNRRIGAGLAVIDGLRYEVTGRGPSVSVNWFWLPEGGCPTDLCDGSWQLTCDSGGCKAKASVGDGALGMDFEEK
ncbi:MAG: hypothetical protein QNK37_02005 [Acidobacteriota bacterium]|nr:hypothetical protein [Acidobacteriota bacterium]